MEKTNKKSTRNRVPKMASAGAQAMFELADKTAYLYTKKQYSRTKGSSRASRKRIKLFEVVTLVATMHKQWAMVRCLISGTYRPGYIYSYDEVFKNGGLIPHYPKMICGVMRAGQK